VVKDKPGELNADIIPEIIAGSMIGLARQERKDELCFNQANREQKAGNDEQFMVRRMPNRRS